MNFFMRTYVKETMRTNQTSPWLLFYLLSPCSLQKHIIEEELNE